MLYTPATVIRRQENAERLIIKGTIVYISTMHIYPQLLVELTGYPDQYWIKSELTIKRFCMWHQDRDSNRVMAGRIVTLDINRYTYEIVGFR